LAGWAREYDVDLPASDTSFASELPAGCLRKIGAPYLTVGEIINVCLGMDLLNVYGSDNVETSLFEP